MQKCLKGYQTTSTVFQKNMRRKTMALIFKLYKIELTFTDSSCSQVCHDPVYRLVVYNIQVNTLFFFIFTFYVGLPLSKEALDDVAEISGVMTNDDYLPADVREHCKSIIPEVDDVKSRDAAETFIFKGTLLKCAKSIITK